MNKVAQYYRELVTSLSERLRNGERDIDALVEQALEGENTALPTFVEARNQFELNYLRKLLQITKGNVTHAARMAGRNRTEVAA